MIGVLALVVLQTAQPAATATPAPKMRCVRVEETGSYVRKKRICRTLEEWRALGRRDDMELDRMRDRTPINSQRPEGG